ncbi:hypothetical protein GCM10027321_21160 [Massilia terrae]|uniref:Oxidoreductase-like domain-containing protein n=1 Tax=Massilia terrae TaxID=1811224 RepID=A0ABT2CV90_9BURK|nr:oxidoreductase-like domain-containing protein [Massilia terrae]MCS0657877.1 oxidoreductase-like domain-containing protein [Massilia terrae]
MKRPVEPELEDCCRSGCMPCIFDIYAEELERYEEWAKEHPEEAARQEREAVQQSENDRRSRAGGNP